MEELGITPELAYGMAALDVWIFFYENAKWIFLETKSERALPVIQF